MCRNKSKVGSWNPGIKSKTEWNASKPSKRSQWDKIILVVTSQPAVDATSIESELAIVNTSVGGQ